MSHESRPSPGYLSRLSCLVGRGLSAWDRPGDAQDPGSDGRSCRESVPEGSRLLSSLNTRDILPGAQAWRPDGFPSLSQG
jgi:hypothetical protein